MCGGRCGPTDAGGPVASGAVPPPLHRPFVTRTGRLIGAVVLVLVLAGCRMQLDTTIVIEDDGSGTVTQAVGLDPAALARIGDLERQVAVDDLRAAGWTVDAPVLEGDTTWVRAHRDVKDTTELAVAVSQLNGAQGPFLDLGAGQRDSFLERVTEFAATYDLTKGSAVFSDPELDAVAGNPWGALLAEIEAEEGRPPTEMVEMSVTVVLPGGVTQTWNPSFADVAPTRIEAKSTESKVTERLAQVGLVVVVLATIGLVWWGLRARRRRRRGIMSSRFAARR